MTWATGTGGDVVEDIVDGDGVTWRYHKFTTVGSSTFTATSAGDVEYLLVGGGGAGGYFGGGGGGAGGLLSGLSVVAPGPYTVVVGAGRPSLGNVVTGRGGSSSAFGVSVLGGGDGGSGISSSSNRRAQSGGSGGGGAYLSAGAGEDGPPRQGFDGGAGRGSGSGGIGGGGGGADDFGKPRVYSTAGDGGDGKEWPTGSGNYYAGGGGGGGGTSVSSGGVGGGGNGSPNTIGANATPNTGGGGGGGGLSSNSGAGGSGIVIVRYVISGTPPTPPEPTEIVARGGTISDELDGSGTLWRYHRFTVPGFEAFHVEAVPEGTGDVEYLIVGGGGAGGYGGGGGGGAGGLLSGTFTVSPQTYTMQTGIASPVQVSGAVTGRAGGSSAFGISVLGGGGGGFGTSSSLNRRAISGGSGGGTGYGTPGLGEVGPPRQGYDGGQGFGSSSTPVGGGGGGAGEVGSDLAGTVAGDGGDGKEWPAGSGTYYAGGGGGGGYAGAVAGSGGLGGGANGSVSAAGANATHNTGGGGGGGGVSFDGGAGGHGIVIVRYPITPPGPTAPTVLTSAANGITKYSAILNGEMTDDGGDTASFAFEVSTSASSDDTFFITESLGTTETTYTYNLEDLNPSTTYYYRAFAISVEGGPGYGDWVSFTTDPGDAPVGLTLNMPDIEEDAGPSVGLAQFETDPEETGTYTWEVSAQIEPPYTGGTSATLTVDGLTAGTVSITGQSDPDKNATISFTPASNWFGTATFSYRVSNGFEFSTWDQATVTVTPVPDAPSAPSGTFPDFPENSTEEFSLTWTDNDDLPPGTLTAAADGYFVQMRPTAGGAWQWLTVDSPTATLTNVTIRVLSYSDTDLSGQFRVEPDAFYYGPYGAQVRVAKQVEDSFLFGPTVALSGTITSVPQAPTRPQPNRMPTAKVGQSVAGRFTTFDADIEDTTWTWEISAAGAGVWGSSLVIPGVGTLTVVDTDLTDQETRVQLVQEAAGATELRYEFDLRVTDNTSLVSDVQRVIGLITLPTSTVFLQKVTRNSPAVITPLTPLVEVFDLNITDSIDGIGGADVTVSTDELRRRASQVGTTVAELLEPGTVELVVAIGTQIVFTGPIGEIEWSATDESVDISARGLLSYFEERRIGTGTTSFVGQDIAAIMWALVDDAQGQSYGDYGITDNTTTAGTNLTVTFEKTDRVLESLRNLAGAEGAPEVWVDPERQLNTATSRGQDRRDLIRLTPGMMTSATWTNRDEQIATVVTVIGGDNGSGGFYEGTAVTSDTTALSKYGRRELLIERKELTSDAQCEDYATRVVEAQARRSETIRAELLITPDRQFSIRDLEVGDIVTVDLRAPDLGQVIGSYRIINRTLNLVSETADSYKVRIDMVPAPFVSGQLVKVKARHNASIVERLAQTEGQQQ